MRIVFGGIAGIVLALMTHAMFFPHALWNEQADRDLPKQEPPRSYKRRTPSDRPREKPDVSRIQPNQKQPDNSVAPPLPKNVPSSPPESAQNVPSTPETHELAREITNTIGMKLVRIDPGEFMMGGPISEVVPPPIQTPHQVTLTKPFMIGVTEVTQGQWQAIMGNNPSYFKGGDLPVEQVSWNDAVEFCRRLSEKEGKRFRLPTEAQWEYACRAGTTTAYSFGDSAAALNEYAWYEGNANSRTHPVGQKLPNAWGLYDMHGNVHEWCSDAYSESPPAGKDPEILSGSRVVGRSSCYHDSAMRCRTVLRGGVSPTSQNEDSGFRVILVASDGSNAIVGASARIP